MDERPEHLHHAVCMQAEHLLPSDAEYAAREPNHPFLRELWDLWQPGGHTGLRIQGVTVQQAL